MRLSKFPSELLAQTQTRRARAGGLALAASAVLATNAHAATVTVINTNNAGVGSLRAALNAAAGGDTVAFAIPGAGPHTIVLTSDLPVITAPITIDGYSQAGSQPATAQTAATLRVAINASNALRGLDIGGHGVQVRGLAIHSAQTDDVFVEGNANVIAGNHIGTNISGTAAVLGGFCNVVLHGQGNRVGGNSAAERNVIAGRFNVCVEGGAHHIIGNHIGTNAQGTAALGGGDGVVLVSDGSQVRNNLVSGHTVGINVQGEENVLEGNRIGTDVSGTLAIPNLVGVNVEGGDYNTIGGTAAGQGNLISGNELSGIQIQYGDVDDPGEEPGPSDGNRILGNWIGTDASGSAPLPNGTHVLGPSPAVNVSGVHFGTVIGGAEPGAGNVIAGNLGHGIALLGATGSIVLGNWIGTNRRLASGLGNGQSGAFISDASESQFGDIGDVPPNVIANNADDGITITETAVDNALVQNVIYANGDLGIDLADDGVTANDAGDFDSGPNDLLNHPLILLASAQTSDVQWTLDGLPATPYRLELYESDACDPAGSGEGQRFLGSIDIVTDVMGVATDTTPLPGLVAQRQVSMTATRKVFAAGGLLATSEFSPCSEVQ